MKSKSVTAIGLLLMVSLAAAAWLADVAKWRLAIISSLAIVSGLVGLLLVGSALIALRSAKACGPGRLRTRAKVLLIGGACLLLQLASIPIALTWRDQEARHAQTFIAALIPQLEAYQRQHGTYPSTLEPLVANNAPLPPLLQLRGDAPLVYNNRDFYVPQGATYGFRFYLPDGFIGFSYEYCCGAQGQWRVTD